MLTCPGCGRENPPDFAFCPACGAQLVPVRRHAAASATSAGAEPVPAQPTLAEERKVVTTLFCDLVSFTAHSEASDHELIDGLLQQYNALTRRLVEEHGGAVEKFIGDAVVAVFGFPRAHEDDAERAVRCGLRLIEGAGELSWSDGDPVQVRIGVNSGETYLHTDIDPASSETFLTGDAVNTAARLESAAPPGGLVVGELTHRLTRHAIAYEELEPISVKGKREPLGVWKAIAPRAGSAHDHEHTSARPHIGRQKELDALVSALSATSAQGESQVVLVVGEPGLGKTRLIAEFARRRHESTERVMWHEGRCPSFGEGIGLAAIGEIVKSLAGIAGTDDATAVEAKLDAALSSFDDGAWVAARLRGLVGLEAVAPSREESMVAWRRFFAGLAREGPAVVAIEDVHWAGEALVEFLDGLAATPVAGPLLVLLTARPEFLDGAGRALAERGVVRELRLKPLDGDDSARLVAGLLDAELSEAVRMPLIERAGGNPLYAEEYVRLLLDRGLLVKADQRYVLVVGEELPLPDTVQAVLAARLDTLPRTHKSLLSQAAVLGERFSKASLVAIADATDDAVGAALAQLHERQLVRPLSIAGAAREQEFAFWHALVRDVAYEQLPRRVRLAKHLAASEWVAGQPNAESVDSVELVAHHCWSAHELADSLRDASQSATLAARAADASLAAGELTTDLDPWRGETHLRRALAVALPESRASACATAALGWTLCEAGQWAEGEALCREAVNGLVAAGERAHAARTIYALVWVLQVQGKPEYREWADRGDPLLEDAEPSRELAWAYAEAAANRLQYLGDPEGAVELVDRALALSKDLGIEASDRARCTRGRARIQLGDIGGLDDLEAAFEESVNRGSVSMSLLGDWYAASTERVTGAGRALAVLRRTIEETQRHGFDGWHALDPQVEMALHLFRVGEWDEGVATVDGLREPVHTMHLQDTLVTLASVEIHLRVARGEARSVEAQADFLAHACAEGTDPWNVVPGLTAAARVYLACGRVDDARVLLDDCVTTLTGQPQSDPWDCLEVLRIALLLGARVEDVARVISGAACIAPRDEAALATARGLLTERQQDMAASVSEFARAVPRWHELEYVYEEAQALLGQGRCLVALGRAPEAAPVLEAAREIFARLGARPALDETNDLLAQAGGGE